MMPVTNPKAWEAVTGFTANIKAAVERLNKLAGYFPESKDHLIAVAARIEAECDATMKFLLAEALAGVESKMDDSDRGSSKGTGSL
jgi:cytochrome c556